MFEKSIVSFSVPCLAFLCSLPCVCVCVCVCVSVSSGVGMHSSTAIDACARGWLKRCTCREFPLTLCKKKSIEKKSNCLFAKPARKEKKREAALSNEACETHFGQE
ncbi:hypothetical protein QBC41DRAFT_13603 [Cercophora samala]|uniref:Secreted protein n=1 Tax=Cercophora samala TaxID=330535 RepID=A0AA40DFT9_9PEZI|nr:hypothetical protein QBC41DRAFT_13603 [Cercophora samala]